MLFPRAMARWLSPAWRLVALGCLAAAGVQAQTNSPVATTDAVVLVAAQGTVEIARAGQAVWDPASTQSPYCRLNPGDQLRTQDRSRATIRLSDLSLVEVGPNAHLQLLPVSGQKPGLGLRRGVLHLFHRDKPDEFYFRTPTASPVIRGTEFNLEVAADGTTTLHLIEGTVTLTNEFGRIELSSGEAGVVRPGGPPQRTAALEAVNVIQWCLYYPAVLNLDELSLGADEQVALAGSLAAYRSGDLLNALANFPSGRLPVSGREKIYLAALLLAVGDVAGAETRLASLDPGDDHESRMAGALRILIAAVKHQPGPEGTATNVPTPLATTLLAESYHHQSRFALEEALVAARRAVGLSPDFGFGWARVAELEFSFGRTREAEAAVHRALALAPRHAQAMAVKGFLLASQNRTDAALTRFEQAIAADNALGNAWLGRGLCRIRQGHTREGVNDLLVAAALEPDRALPRSYLGKGFGDVHDPARAEHELLRARQLDPNDPTACLYLALLNQQRNRVNEAVRDLEHSKELNDNRQVFRSRLLLDQDRAVRQANLAAIYQDAGLFEEGVREASRAVSGDYANPAAHLFLANSYAARGDADPVSLRYETAMFSEYLVAQLLAPVGGNSLSPHVSQQEYSRLFQSDGFRLSSDTEYRSGGDWRQRGVQSGAFEKFDYALDAYYATQNGERPNHDAELLTLSAALRLQLTPQDTVFVQAVHTEFESGDLRRLQDPATADRNLRVEESQSPNLFLGYHREWSPGSHTLLAAACLNDDFRIITPQLVIQNLLRTFVNGDYSTYDTEPSGSARFTDDQGAEFRAVSMEVQQLWQGARHTLVIGGRHQTGEAEARLSLRQVAVPFLGIPLDPLDQRFTTELRRASAYAYEHWRACDELVLIGGVSFDWLDYPDNIDLPPFNASQRQAQQWSPKAGVVWSPATNALVRAAYTRSLGGLYYDQSVRLEPSQVAGFAQAFRSLIPASAGGLVAGAEFETAGLEFSWHGRGGTYFGIGGEWLRSDGERTVGVVDTSAVFLTTTPSGTPQTVEFEEKSLTASLQQLVGERWALGVRYRVSDAELEQRMTRVIADLSRFNDGRLERATFADTVDEGVLQQLEFSARHAHPCGFFGEARATWFAQQNSGAGDEYFWQVNLAAGYRFAQRRAELSAGLLNLTDEDYRLNPVNEIPALPRERTLFVRFKFNF